MSLLKVNNLVVGQKYRVTRHTSNGGTETFDGYYSSRNENSIVFSVKGKGRL